MIDDNTIIEPEDQFGLPGEAYREIIREKDAEIARLRTDLDTLTDEINNYLNNDGSRGVFWAIALSNTREALESILAQRAREAAKQLCAQPNSVESVCGT